MELKIRGIKIVKDDKYPTFLINGEEFTMEEFSKSFISSFCLTGYKYEGGDVNRMDKKQFYTSLSRTTKFKFIRLDETMLLKSYQIRRLPELELINAKHNSLYKNSKICGITFDNNVICWQYVQRVRNKIKMALN